MLNKCIYTVMSLLLAVAFVFGNMYIFNEFLGYQKRKLLTEEGKAAVESPVMPLKELLEDRENAQQNEEADEIYELTTEDMQSVLICRNEGKEVVHDPVEGQISMNEAIKAGYEWLKKMNINVTEKKGVALNYVNAMLYAVTLSKENVGKIAPYYSFWRIALYTEEANITLDINAVTSKVWNADIVYLYNERDESMLAQNYYDSITEFVELSGISEAEVSVCDYTDDSLTVGIENTDIFANICYSEAVYAESKSKVALDNSASVYMSSDASYMVSYSLQL